MRELVTQEEKAEFIRRCKWLALHCGERTSYYPATFYYTDIPDLRVEWQPDRDRLSVKMSRPRNNARSSWLPVFDHHRSRSKWGWIDRIPEFNRKMRALMVLDDLANA
jgi:hypothetical protein